MLLSKLASADISWWIRNALTSKRRIDHGKISHTLYTDTSTQGRGASLKDTTTGGWSSTSEEGHHINYLELKPFSWACSLFVRKCPMITSELWLVLPLLWNSHFERSPLTLSVTSYDNKGPLCYDISFWKWKSWRSLQPSIVIVNLKFICFYT